MCEPEFKIEPATIENSVKILKFLQISFYSDGEPLNQCLDKKQGEKLNLERRGHYHIGKIPEGLSFIAVNPVNNEIIGVVINERLLKRLTDIEIDQSTYESNPNLHEIGRLLKDFERQTEEIEGPLKQDEKWMSIEVISVHPGWRNKGIALALAEKTINFAQQNGFKRIRSICTSYYSTKLFEKCGFRAVHSLKYEDYKNDGEIVFKMPFPHTHVTAMALEVSE